MCPDSRSPPRSRVHVSEGSSYRDTPYRRDYRGFRGDQLCNNCKRPGHFARDCPNVSVCNNCQLPGHIAAECTSTTMCWNCREPGHMASQCSNEPLCHICGNAGHLARECSKPMRQHSDTRLCNNCYKQGHLAAELLGPMQVLRLGMWFAAHATSLVTSAATASNSSSAPIVAAAVTFHMSALLGGCKIVGFTGIEHESLAARTFLAF